MVYDLIGALGGPFCKHGPRQLFANREEAKGWIRNAPKKKHGRWDDMG